jgi:hypothetical protein
MALKTFNLDDATHKKYAEHCKREGISMSKKVENFIKKELELLENPIPKKISPIQKKLLEQTFKKYC